MATKSEAREVAVESREALREWLERHHGEGESVWLVRWKKGSGKPHVPYGDVVDECLCFGWIDSLPRKLDERRSKLRISPRDPRSNWSGTNKRRVARLEREGRMAAAGHAAVELARRNGAWSFLDEVERLEIPDDLARALDGVADARARFARFPDSSKRGILEWIKNAKREKTRATRVRETAEKAARNVKANHPAGRDVGPALPDEEGR